MLEVLGKGYRLVSRGGAGLSCDEEGVSLGNIALVRRDTSKSDHPYAPIERPRLIEALMAAYGFEDTAEFQRIEDRLVAVARALNAGNVCLAAITAVQMRMPELSAYAERRLDALQKYNPNQPHVPAGNPDGGEWTSDTENQSGEDRPPTRTAQIPLPMPLPIPIPGLPGSPVAPNIPFPQLFDPPPANPFPDRPECVEEWSKAYDFCRAQMLHRLLKPGFRGFGKDFNRCVLGQVSADCGGNPTGQG